MDRVAVSVSEFKSATGLSRPTIYRMMQQGNLRFAQIGGLRRIPVSEFKRLGLV
jgi:excisionase family DNA binding protein